MNCCNDFNQCTQGANCPARKRTTHQVQPPFGFCHNDKSPHIEVAGNTFYFLGFACLVAVICAAAGLAWGLLVRFAPNFVQLLQYLFS